MGGRGGKEKKGKTGGEGKGREGMDVKRMETDRA